MKDVQKSANRCVLVWGWAQRNTSAHVPMGTIRLLAAFYIPVVPWGRQSGVSDASFLFWWTNPQLQTCHA